MSNTDVTVYLIRHGRTALNAAGVLRGRLDPSLDPTGLAEAEALGGLFISTGLVAAVSSPLGRARQTATAIAEAVGAPVEFDDALADRDYGTWAGTARDEVERRFAITPVRRPGDRRGRRGGGAVGARAGGDRRSRRRQPCRARQPRARPW